MRFTQATLLALSSGVLSGMLVSAAPSRDRRALTADVQVLACGGDGVSVKPGKHHNCPEGWVLSIHTPNLCVEIGEESGHTTRKSSSSHKTTTTRKSATSTRKTSSTRSTNKASSSVKPSSSSKPKPATSKPATTTTTTKKASTKPSSSRQPSGTVKPAQACGQGRRWDALLEVCVDVGVPGAGSVKGGVDVGKGGVDGGVTVDIPGLASIGGGVKLGHLSARMATATKAGGPRATPKAGCSDHDALLNLCIKVAGVATVDASVAGKDGLVTADAAVAGIPIKATVLGKDAAVDAHVGSHLLDATLGGQDTLIRASVGDVVKVTSNGAATTGRVVRCPKGQLLHLGICLDVDVNLLGLRLDTAVIVAL